MPEVLSHQGPPAQLSKAYDFCLSSNLPVWKYEATGFRALMVERPQLQTLEQRRSTMLASCMWFGTPKEPPQPLMPISFARDT